MGNLRAGGRPFSPQEQQQLELALILLLEQVQSAAPLSLSVTLLQDWHAILSAGIGRMQPGLLRQTDITFGSYFGTAPARIATELDELVAWHLQHWPELVTPQEVVGHATGLHAELLRIHPFWDGNGRLARAVQAWLCWQGGLDAPQYEDRPAYIAALNRYHHTRDLSLLLDVTWAAIPGPDLR